MDTHLASPGYQALRRGRVSLPSQIYLLTTVTHGRTPIFLNPALAMATCRRIGDASLWRNARLLCWVLMPDHWHGVLELGHYEPLGDLVRRFKSITALEVNRDRRATGSVWASGFHDHALRFEEDLVGVARYVVANPIRAGLASRVGDYPYWNAVWI
jgi:REP element-mobilizing transposase RayT